MIERTVYGLIPVTVFFLSIYLLKMDFDQINSGFLPCAGEIGAYIILNENDYQYH